MLELYERAIATYRNYEHDGYVVANSLPILFFGDLTAYRASNFKVVTVGLNPSDKEFTQERFGKELEALLTPARLGECLSNYFKHNPYEWFRCYETLLQFLGTSYYGSHYPRRPPTWWQPQRNVALHTDIATPLATNPTWKRLAPERRTAYGRDGFPLWKDLISELAPDLVLISVATPHLAKLGDLSWRTFDAFAGCNPRTFTMKVSPFGTGVIVWGSANLTPMMNLRLEHRPAAAEAILREWEAVTKSKPGPSLDR